MKKDSGFNRREFLAAASGAGVLAAAGPWRSAFAAEMATIRQGYQTNMWGMPTYFFLKSGELEKRGIKYEEFAVPSGNLTMQQMVARQVDMGTYAGPSFIIGHDKGGLLAIAVIENVGRTAKVVVGKDAGITKVEQLRGKKIANQTGSSIGNIFVNILGPSHGLKPGDYQEVRMNVNDMVAALAAKTVDAMVNIEPYNAIAEADGIGKEIASLEGADKVPVFMAATPEFVEKHPDTIVEYLKAWLVVGQTFKNDPNKPADAIYEFFGTKGYKMSKDTFKKALSAIDVNPGFPSDLAPYMQEHAEVLLKAKRIKAIPDWNKALRTEFMKKAMA